MRRIALVTPALAEDNNGNWQTAARWARLLSGRYRVQTLRAWAGEPADALLALHARRSAASIDAWHRQRPGAPLVVALTGTDLYRDLPAGDADALGSLDQAHRLIVLNERAAAALPAEAAERAVTCLQSVSARQPVVKPQRWMRVLVVGHLRPEKGPDWVFEVVRRLVTRPDIRIDHIGAPLDPALGAQAQALAASHAATYRWLGARPHREVRRRIQQAHLLLHPSRMEGGAHVVIEAVRSGTPVVGTAIDGNTGLLGTDYPALVAPGHTAALAAWLLRCRDEPGVLERLAALCAQRAPLFAPERERQVLRGVFDALFGLPPLGSPTPAPTPPVPRPPVPMPATSDARPPPAGAEPSR